jgi:shikimate dehydrogenase
MNCLYMPFDMKPEDLRKFIESVRLLGISGFNVTIPHKKQIIRYLDDLDNSARSVGAVNLVINRKGILVGYNTDSYGIKATIEDHLKFSINNRRVVLIGAGGAARAAIKYLRKKKPASVILANRTIKRAKKLQEILQKPIAEVVPVGKLAQCTNDLDIDMVINATPVASTVLLKNIPSSLRIFDMSYRPGESPYGRSRIRCDGKYMLAAQASRGISILCGVKIAVDEVFKLIKRQ